MNQPDPQPSAGARQPRIQWPVVLAEIISIVAAVLIALAVDEWWEDRENVEMAQIALAAVVEEVRSNRLRLAGAQEQINSVLEELQQAVTLLQNDETPTDLGVDYSVALLSSAAWQTAQVTRAVHYLEWETVAAVASVYDLQNFFLRNQDQLTDLIAEMSITDNEDPAPMIRRIATRFRMVVGFRNALAGAQACLLVQVERANAQEQSACPAPEPPAAVES